MKKKWISIESAYPLKNKWVLAYSDEIYRFDRNIIIARIIDEKYYSFKNHCYDSQMWKIFEQEFLGAYVGLEGFSHWTFLPTNPLGDEWISTIDSYPLYGEWVLIYSPTFEDNINRLPVMVARVYKKPKLTRQESLLSYKYEWQVLDNAFVEYSNSFEEVRYWSPMINSPYPELKLESIKSRFEILDL